ncbi:MAG: CD225/dispanin family protein [Bacteroidetes bacterium]|nr:CD225/dispanin family protein [Bacteroidota bacterium]
MKTVCFMNSIIFTDIKTNGMSALPGTIFINYRKDDTRWNALALYNELQKYFEKDQIFKDFNTILPGDDFVVSIENALRKCDVLLVVIGPNWLSMKDESGNRRLDDPDDFVRLEVSTALSRNIQVIPVLIDNTVMPKAADLPENMKSLYRRQFVEIDNTRFEDDVRNLAEAIKKVLPEGSVRVQHEEKNKYDDRKEEAEIKKKKVSAKPKPANNLVMGILATILCFPLGIVSIIAANKVDSLWSEGKFDEAIDESRSAQKWAIIAIISALIVYVIYAIGVADQVNNY